MIGTLFHSFDTRMPSPRSMKVAAIAVLISVALALIVLNSARAVAPSNEYFQRTWERTDKPIIDGIVSRSWNWGPEGISNEVTEPYMESPDGVRQVQYFDKSRMEINDPNGDPASIWYVTNGLLVVELMTGRMQIGDNAFQDRFPAAVPVAGDPNDPNGVTYAVFADFRETSPMAANTVYTQRLHPDGTVTSEATMAAYDVSASFLDDVTNHRIAGPFWEYMNSSGPVYVDGELIDDLLFPNAFYSTGRPITEFYWVRSQVGGTERDVGIQCFERRCLTYTPGNSEGFVIEDGNVGLHYFIWRYETPDPTPTPTATSPATATLEPTPTATVTAIPTVTVPGVVGVIVGATVDCDNFGTPEGTARPVGDPGVCQDFLGGEIDTVTEGNPTAVDEIQQLGLNDATGGTISITFDHPLVIDTIIVTGIPYDATAQEIEDALELGFISSGVGLDTPTVSPVSSDSDAQLNEAAMRFTFENGSLAATNVSQLVVDNAPLIGETTAGTFSTVVEGTPVLDEIQQLSPNEAGAGTFTLEFDHPTAGLITTDPITYDASAAFVEFELGNAFGGEGVGADAPTVSGGPANAAALEFVFENGGLAGVNVPTLSVNNAGLASEVVVSEVDVLNEASTTIATWQIDEDGNATGMLAPGTYEFCFTYAEDSGQSDTACTGLVEVSQTSFAFTLTAFLDHEPL
ncbi:hypothetical protein BH23CHL2_BH23CHL2_28170 [soil metagenome]